MWVMRRKVTAAGQPGNRKDAGAPEGRPSCGRNPDNSALGSTLSLFLNFFPPSAPELMRCEFRPAGVPVLVVAAITSRVQSNNERGCGQGTT